LIILISVPGVVDNLTHHFIFWHLKKEEIMTDFRTELDKVTDQGCIFGGACCIFAAWADWEHTMRGALAESEMCCFKYEGCAQGGMVSFPLGMVDRAEQHCNFSALCFNIGIINPTVCFKGRGQMFCLNGRGECPCVDSVPFIIGAYGITCHPVVGCCIPIESVSKPALASTSETPVATAVGTPVTENKA